MTQHSKGTWRRSPYAPDAIITDDSDGLGPDDEVTRGNYGGFVVAESVVWKNIPLITAAPDLLDECRNALDVLEENGSVDGGPDCIVTRLKAVIAKATGQEVQA